MGGISVLFMMGMVSAFLIIFIWMFIACLIYSVVRYVLEGISVMRMAERLGYKHGGVAWIPFYNNCLIGKIAGARTLGIISFVLSVITFGISICYYIMAEGYPIVEKFAFPAELALLAVKFVIDSVIAHKIYRKALGNNGDIMTVLTCLSLGLLRPIFFFAVRNKVGRGACGERQPSPEMSRGE